LTDVMPPMRKVLYILSKGPVESADSLYPPPTGRNQEVSALLIQDAAALEQAPGGEIHILADDVALRNAPSSSATVSYREMLRMIFEADGIVAL